MTQKINKDRCQHADCCDICLTRECEDMDNTNKAFHEAARKCWHEELVKEVEDDSGFVTYICSCGSCYSFRDHIKKHIAESNPDYCDDPRLVIEVMRKREDWDEFCIFVEQKCWYDAYPWIDLFMDKTGKLRDLALEWLEKEKGKE